MSVSPVVFDHVWKKFRRGQSHDSLRDLIPATLRGLIKPSRNCDLADEEFWVLKDVSFSVSRGETLGIIGRNGVGKSTTLKLLTRILKPTLGRSLVHGRVGALIELAAGFHPDLTGRENVFLQGAIMGMRRPEIARRFDEIVDFSGIGEFIDTQVKRYSSGMQARLGFSVAAHLNPDVLIIDEVLAVGDLSFQQKCFERLGAFKRSGVTIVFVSHNMQAISAVCDRVLYLRRGDRPLLTDVPSAIRAYISADTSDVDPRVRVISSRFGVEGSLTDLVGSIKPGTRLVLSCRIVPNVDMPRCGFFLMVRRADGILIFHGGSSLDGVTPIHLEKGREAALEVSFRANLLRGTFTVGVALFDESRIWERADLGVLGSFVTEETTRVDGVAELEPSYKFIVSDPTDFNQATLK